MLRSISSRSAVSRFGLAPSRSAQISAALPSTAATRSFTHLSVSGSQIASSSRSNAAKLALNKSALSLQSRQYATPAEEGEKKKSSAQEHDEDDKKKKEFEESVERGLKEARQGKAGGSLPENLKQFFDSDDKKARASKSDKEPARDEDDEVAEKKKKKADKSSGANGSAGGGPNGQYTEIRINANTIFATIVSTYLLYRLTSPDQPSREITWQEFRTAFLDKGLVDRLVVVNRSKVKVYLHSNATGSMYPSSGGSSSPASGSGHAAYWFSVGSVEAFERRLDEAQRELDIPGNERIPWPTTRKSPPHPPCFTLLPPCSSPVSSSGCRDELLVAPWAAVEAADLAASSASARAAPRCSTRRPTSRPSSRTSPAWTRPRRKSWSLSTSSRTPKSTRSSVPRSREVPSCPAPRYG